MLFFFESIFQSSLKSFHLEKQVAFITDKLKAECVEPVCMSIIGKKNAQRSRILRCCPYYDGATRDIVINIEF